MPVLKEYVCHGHGRFEAFEARCPKGCTTVEQRFYTPVGTRSDTTKHNDRTLNQLALDFGVSNFQTDGHKAARVHTPQQKAAMEQQRQLQARFGAMPKGGALEALRTMKAPETNVFSEVKPQLANMKRQVVVKQDPDRSSREKVMQAAA